MLDENALPPVMRPPRTVFVRGPAARYQGMPGNPAPEATAIPLPGSKYYTLRYLLNALLARGESLVRHPALSEDTAVLVRALRALGAEAHWERMPGQPSGWQLRVRGVGGRPRVSPDGILNVGNAGAVLRLLLGVGALLPEVRLVTDHPASLGRRPNADLLAALAGLGVAVEAQEPGGLLPITLRGGSIQGGPVAVSGAHSSQYLSALLYLAPLLPRGLEITVTDGLRSAPLVRATLRALAAAGVVVEAAPDLTRFSVAGGQRFLPREYDVPGDGPTAAALVTAALTLDAPLQVARLSSVEEDVQALVAALRTLGADLPTALDEERGVLALRPGARLYGATLDGDACIDSVPVLVAAACFARGETRFANVATLRWKESDRIGDLCAELQRAGGEVEPLPDAIRVQGHPEGIAGGATVQAHDDHRLAQALAVAALGSRDGLTITGAEAVAKSYPSFFADLARLGAEVRVVEE